MRRLLDTLHNLCERKSFAILAIVVVCSATTLLPIATGGIRRIPDLRFYASFAMEFQSAFAEGHLYPGWANNNLGFGSIGIRFYPPAAALVTAIVQTVTGDWFFAFGVCIFGWMTLGCVGVYLFAREWGSPMAGLLAALLYSVTPFHLAEVFRFFLYAEFAGGAVLPLCFLFLTRVCRRGRWADVILLAACVAALMLTHLPLTIMAAVTFLAFAFLVIDWSHWRSISLRLLASAVLAAMATSYYWVRVCIELAWVAHSGPGYTIAGSGFGPFLFPNSIGGNVDELYLHLFRHLDAMILMTMVLFIPFLALMIAEGKRLCDPQFRVLIAASVAAFGGFFMVSKPSWFLWSSIDILQRLQFPWRWVSIISVLSATSFSLSLRLLTKSGRLSNETAVLGTMFLIAVFAAYDIREIRTTPSRIPRTEFNAVVQGFRAQPTSLYWWPTWARQGALDRAQPIAAGDRRVEVTSWERESRAFIVGDGPPGEARIATFYYPYWKATSNGRTIEVGRDEDGAITLPLGNGEAEVQLWFEEPKLYSGLWVISVAAWVFLLAALAIEIVTRRLRTRTFAE